MCLHCKSLVGKLHTGFYEHLLESSPCSVAFQTQQTKTLLLIRGELLPLIVVRGKSNIYFKEIKTE